MGPRSHARDLCFLAERGRGDVDRRGNNNENTIRSRLHSLKYTPSTKKKKNVKKILQGVARKIGVCEVCVCGGIKSEVTPEAICFKHSIVVKHEKKKRKKKKHASGVSCERAQEKPSSSSP